MNKFSPFIFLLALSLTVHGQTTFQKYYGFQSNPELSGLVITQDNGYAMVGIMGYQSWFLKTDHHGQVLINKMLETPDTYYVRSMDATSDGGFILSASGRAGPQEYNLNLTKLDSLGNILWTNNFGNSGRDLAYAVRQTNDGGFIACGSTTILQGSRTYLVKTDAMGNLLWTKTIADNIQSTSSNTPNNIIQTNDQGFLISGTVTISSSDFDAYLVKTDSTGNIIWSKVYSFPQWNSIQEVKITNDGGYILSGWVDLTNDSIDNQDMSLIKTDLFGNVLWAKAYTKPGKDISFQVELSSDNGYVLCGSIDDNTSTSKCVLIKTDSLGQIIWTDGFSSLNYSTLGNMIRRTHDNGFIIGSTYAPNFPAKIYLIKIGENGSSNCSQSSPVFMEESISLSINSSVIFTTGTNDTLANLPLTTNPLAVTTNTICFTDDINKLNKADFFSVYPNPAQESLYISSAKDSEFEIFNLCGQKIFESGPSVFRKGLNEVNISSLSKGMYFIVSESLGIKFIKE